MKEVAIFEMNSSVLIKNKAIKKILDSLDLCSLEEKQKTILRTTILNEMNEMYRQLIIGDFNGK